MQPISTPLNSKKNKSQFSNEYKKQRKKKNSHQSRNEDSNLSPQIPANILERFPAYDQAEHYARTASLARTLIKAVENQKQILRNIKSISAQILKDQKARQSVSQSQQSQPASLKHVFPIKKLKSQNREPFYGISESESSENQIETSFDEYCFLNTVRPKRNKIDIFDMEEQLKPKMKAQEVQGKKKSKKKNQSKKEKRKKYLKPNSLSKSTAKIVKEKQNSKLNKSQCRLGESSSLTYLSVKRNKK